MTLLQPTSPLRDVHNIKEAISLYDDKKASAIISVCELDHPIQYCNQLPDTLSMKDFISTGANCRSQDLERYYRVNGAIYIFDRKFVGALSDIYSINSFAYVMSRFKSIDIDTYFDLKLAEFIKTQHI
ncbi:N-acylneuraminate cytidylyltransferase [compost metagenome]